MSDENGLANVNMSIKSCVSFMNEIGRLRIKIEALAESNECADWHVRNYENHISLVSMAMANYLERFDEEFSHDAKLIDELYRLHRSSMELNCRAYLYSNWFVPPPFKTADVSRLHHSVRYSSLVSGIKQRCSTVNGKSKYIYHYYPKWTLSSALRRLNALQIEMNRWKNLKPDMERQVLEGETRKAELALRSAHLKSLVEDDNQLFSAIPEYQIYCQKVRQTLRDLHTRENGYEAGTSIKNRREMRGAQLEWRASDQQIGSIRQSEPRESVFSSYRSSRATSFHTPIPTEHLMSLLEDDGLGAFEPVNWDSEEEVLATPGTSPTSPETLEGVKYVQFQQLSIH